MTLVPWLLSAALLADEGPGATVGLSLGAGKDLIEDENIGRQALPHGSFGVDAVVRYDLAELNLSLEAAYTSTWAMGGASALPPDAPTPGSALVLLVRIDSAWVGGGLGLFQAWSGFGSPSLMGGSYDPQYLSSPLSLRLRIGPADFVYGVIGYLDSIEPGLFAASRLGVRWHREWLWLGADLTNDNWVFSSPESTGWGGDALVRVCVAPHVALSLQGRYAVSFNGDPEWEVAGALEGSVGSQSLDGQCSPVWGGGE